MLGQKGEVDVFQVLGDGSVFVRCLACAVEECWAELSQEGGLAIANQMRTDSIYYKLSNINDPYLRALISMALENKGFRRIAEIREKCDSAPTIWQLYELLCKTYGVQRYFK